MTFSFQKSLTCLLALSISACSFIGKTEIDTLKKAAIQDAQKSPKNLKLDYIKCYALEYPAKERCYQILSKYSASRNNAESWAYINPFDKEMEFAGFVAFLNNSGKTCSVLTEEPKQLDKNNYQITCKDSNIYNMVFTREDLSWVLVE